MTTILVFMAVWGVAAVAVALGFGHLLAQLDACDCDDCRGRR